MSRHLRRAQAVHLAQKVREHGMDTNPDEVSYLLERHGEYENEVEAETHLKTAFGDEALGEVTNMLTGKISDIADELTTKHATTLTSESPFIELGFWGEGARAEIVGPYTFTMPLTGHAFARLQGLPWSRGHREKKPRRERRLARRRARS